MGRYYFNKGGGFIEADFYTITNVDIGNCVIERCWENN